MADLLKYTFKHRFQTHSGLLLDMGTRALAWRSKCTLCRDGLQHKAAMQQTLPVAWAWMARSRSSIAKLHFHSGTGILWKHSYNEPCQLDKPYRERERTHSMIYSLVCGNERNVQKRKSKALSLSTA